MSDKQINKDRYRILCNERTDIPLFMQSWWMDAVCNFRNWDVFIYDRDNKILGVLVYHFVKKLGFKIIVQPQLTQFNGIWVNNSNNLSKNEKLRFEKEVMTHLINQLEELNFSYYDQNFHHSITNWLPFFWKKFEQTTRYTYQILNISKPDVCFKQFRASKKAHINKAKETINISLETSGEEFYKHLKQT